MSKPIRVMLIDDDENDCFFFQSALEELDPLILFSYNRDSEAALTNLIEADDFVLASIWSDSLKIFFSNSRETD